MKNNFRIMMFLALAFLSIVTAQTTGDLIMVRCDDGNNGFLSSPNQVKLDHLRNTFDKNKDTLVMIHGYMNDFDSAKGKYGAAHKVLQSNLGNINYVGIYWPVDFVFDFGKGIEHANQSGPYILYTLEKINEWYQGNGGKIHLLSHSLGGRVLLSTLKKNNSRYINWGICSLFGAAVPNDSFFDEFNQTNAVADHNWVYYSRNDWILKYLYALWYWMASRDGIEQSPQAQEFKALAMDKKIEYMKNLENRRSDQDSEFDQALRTNIERAQKDAMGLSGAELGSTVEKVSNIDVSDVVQGHDYWNNGQVLRMVATKILKSK